MEAELAASVATALVQHMVADSWGQVHERLVAFFARNGATTEEEAVVTGELEASRGELTAARDEGDDPPAGDVEAEWRARLRRRLAADPQAADELRATLTESAPAGDVHNTISGTPGIGGPVIQAAGTGSINFGTERRRTPFSGFPLRVRPVSGPC
ncbi:hypothetical protein ACFWNT_19175 [Streptomyces sp. NPDC058409]|uniref:hypothetical protein n=1 Tax=Streptomyces sp. NPDC058409 TaxID=3346484 RepID=UPI003649A132